MYVTNEQIEEAKQVDLYEYMKRCHADAVRREGKYVYLVDNNSIKITMGTQAAYDFETGKSWGSIKFLQEILGYSFPDAVMELLGVSSGSAGVIEKKRKRKKGLPKDAETTEEVQRYLMGRGIEQNILYDLIKSDLLYQDTRKNCVFISREKNYAEVRASNEIPLKTGKPYRRTWAKNGFCWNMSWGTPKKGCRAYICESCIDAISLAQILREEAFYISVGGAGQKKRIKQLIEYGSPCELVLAVDADPAGDACREAHKELSAIIPEGGKDWNEVLKNQERK